MNLDEKSKSIKNNIDKYGQLNKSFTQLKEAESKASKDRIENFETLFQLKENDNDGLKNINDKFREEMKKLEDDRGIHLKKISELIIPITEIYPSKLKKQKIELDDEAKREKQRGPAPVGVKKNNSKNLTDFEKKFLEFEKNLVQDEKYLFMHFIHSEMKYHSAALERLNNLFYQIVNLEPKAYLAKFVNDFKIDIDKLPEKYSSDIKAYEMEDKNNKKKEEEEKIEVFDSNNGDEENSKSSFIESKTRSKTKKSANKKSNNESSNNI